MEEEGPLEALFEQQGLFGLKSSALKPVWDSKDYWNKRYELEEKERPIFDWYESYSHFRGFILQYLKKETSFQILEIGCGNSELGASLYNEDYNIISTDYSDIVVEMMNERAKKMEKKGLKYLVEDVRSLSFADESFSVVLDKATSDAIYINGNEGNQPDFKKMLKEIKRVLQNGGFWIVLTRKITMQWFHLDDNENKSIFQLENQVKLTESENSENYYFIYVFQKVDKE